MELARRMRNWEVVRLWFTKGKEHILYGRSHYFVPPTRPPAPSGKRTLQKRSNNDAKRFKYAFGRLVRMNGERFWLYAISYELVYYVRSFVNCFGKGGLRRMMEEIELIHGKLKWKKYIEKNQEELFNNWAGWGRN